MNLLNTGKLASFSKILLGIISLITLSVNLTGQDLNVYQTLDYLNKKAREFPYNSGSLTFVYNFNMTPSGELKIEQKAYSNSLFEPGKISLMYTTIYRIAVDNISLIESFQTYKTESIPYIFDIKPKESGKFYEERIDDSGVQEYKKTVGYMTTLPNIGSARSRISVYLGDAGSMGSFKNALNHLCTLVISDPVKYGLNKETDPFASPNKPNKTVLMEGMSNTIKIERSESDLIEVPIVLNDVLRINFIFDSGASEVSLSPDVALTLMRTGTISEDDWLESQTYIFADGSSAKSKRFLIRKLVIGNQVLTNIEAGISNSINAPMLIGQNVMQKLGTVTIDYDNMLLIIKPK